MLNDSREWRGQYSPRIMLDGRRLFLLHTGKNSSHLAVLHFPPSSLIASQQRNITGTNQFQIRKPI